MYDSGTVSKSLLLDMSFSISLLHFDWNEKLIREVTDLFSDQRVKEKIFHSLG